MNESLTLAKHITDISYDDIPEHVIAITKKSVLDALAVTLAAGTLGEGCNGFIQLAIACGGKRESTIVGFSAKVPAHMAAFANGAMAHALDFEDAHDGALVHPNAATVPAALAVAESIGNINGKVFLTAVALGCDLVCRLGLALNEDLLKYGWYMPPILGAFGATAAAGKLLNLTAKQMVDAFSLTLCQATCSGELTQSPHSVVRSVRDAFSAKAGVLSALLAKEGVTGFDHPFEGKLGLFNMYARGNYDPAKMTAGLGRVFEGANVSFKPWPSCRGTHAYIDAVLQIRQSFGVKASDVRGIRAVVAPVNKMLCEPLERKWNPVKAIDAKFSIPFVVAIALVHGRVSLNDFAPHALSNQNVLEIARKVKYEVDNSLTARDATRGFLEISTENDRFAKTIDYPYGHPNNPIGEDKLVAKFVDCAQYAVRRYSEKQLDDLVEMILKLEKVDRISELAGFL